VIYRLSDFIHEDCQKITLPQTSTVSAKITQDRDTRFAQASAWSFARKNQFIYVSGHEVLPDPPFGFQIVTLFTVVLLAFAAEATMLDSNSGHKKTSPCHFSKN